MFSSCKTRQFALAFLVAAAAVLPARAVEPDKLVPSDSEAVIVINVRQMLDSGLIKKYALEQMQAAIKGNAEAKKMMEATGLDPLKDIDSITMSVLANAGDPKVLAFVRGKFDLDKLQSALAEFAKAKPDDLSIETKGGQKVYVGKGKGSDKAGYFTFANKNTLVFAQSSDAVLAGAKGTDAGKPAEAMVTALGKIGGKESLYLAAIITDELRKHMAANPKMKELAPKLQALTGTFDLTDDFKLNLTVHTSDAKAADQVKIMVSQFMPVLGLMAASNEKAGPIIGELLKKIEVKKDKTAVSVVLTVTEEMMKEFSKGLTDK